MRPAALENQKPTPRVKPRQPIVLTQAEIHTNRNRVIGLLGAVLGTLGLVIGLQRLEGKPVPPDSTLGQELAPVAEAYKAEAERFGSFGEMFAAYQPREDETRTEIYRTPLEEIEDQRGAIIASHGCTDKSIWTVGESDFEVKIEHMVADMDTRVNTDCKTNNVTQ